MFTDNFTQHLKICSWWTIFKHWPMPCQYRKIFNPHPHAYATWLLWPIGIHELKREMKEFWKKEKFPNQIIVALKHALQRSTKSAQCLRCDDCNDWMVTGIFIIRYWKRGNVQTILNTLRWIRNEEHWSSTQNTDR